MAEAAAWKVLARQQAVEAGGCCDVAYGLLSGAHGLLEEALEDLAKPALVDIPMAWRARTWARRAEGMLAKASGDLAAAASLARAAGLVALRGGAAPAAPAPGPVAASPRLSITDVPDEDLRAALDKLEKAAKGFGSACDLACVSRGHLVGALRLLDHPHPLPGGVKVLVNGNLGDARHNIDDARRFAKKSGELVDGALAALL